MTDIRWWNLQTAYQKTLCCHNDTLKSKNESKNKTLHTIYNTLENTCLEYIKPQNKS